MVTAQAAELKGSRSVATDADGRFEFQHLPAAEITLTAGKTGFLSTAFGQILLPGEAEDPEFLADLRESAERFTLGEGGQQALALTLTRVERQEPR